MSCVNDLRCKCDLTDTSKQQITYKLKHVLFGLWISTHTRMPATSCGQLCMSYHRYETNNITIETNSITTRLTLNECCDIFFLSLSIISFESISPGTREPRDRYRCIQSVGVCRLQDDTATR